MGHSTTAQVLSSESKAFKTPLCYQPLNYLNCEPRDLVSLQNLDKWAEQLCRDYEDDVAPLSGDDICHNLTIESLTNNYTFILASQGQFAQSEKVLQQMIGFWGEKYAQTNDVQVLCKCVQSTINLARLYRMQQDFAKFWQIFDQYQCLDDRNEVELAGYSVEKQQLGEVLGFLQRVSLWECIKTYIIEQRYSELLALEQQLPSKLIKTRVYREAQIIALLNTGQFEQAKRIIRGVMVNTHGIVQNMFYYRYYELLKCEQQDDVAASILADICALVSDTQLLNLEERMFAAKLVLESEATFDSPLSQHVLAQFNQVDDEFNHGKLLLQLYQANPNDELKQQLIELAQTTDYTYLHFLISKNIDVAKMASQSPWSAKMAAYFQQVLLK